jgi:hypothetical protein
MAADHALLATFNKLGLNQWRTDTCARANFVAARRIRFLMLPGGCFHLGIDEAAGHARDDQRAAGCSGINAGQSRFWCRSSVSAGRPWPHFGHTFSDRIEIRFEQIGVGVQRHRRAGVPEHPLHHLRVSPGRDSQRGRGVPQCVRGHPRECRVSGLAACHRVRQPRRRR